MTDSTEPWSVPIRLDDVPPDGRRFDLQADEQSRAAIARAAGIDGLARLEAHLDVHPEGGGLRVSGAVEATVAQTCVVTLDPLLNEVREAVDVAFHPNASKSAVAEEEGGTVAVGEIDPPEPLIGDGIDLGALAVQFLMLGIDPYPRKPDAAFEAPAAEPKESAFAALAALRKSPQPKE